MKIVTPVSDYFQRNDIHDICNLSDILEIRDRDVIPPERDFYFYHSNMNILSKWNSTEKAMLCQKAKDYHVTNFSCHILTLWKKYIIKDNHLIPDSDVGSYTLEEAFKNAQKNLSTIKKTFGSDIEISLENVPYIDSTCNTYKPAFIADLLHSLGVSLLLDFAHALVTSINTNQEFYDYLYALPLDSCTHIHLSKISINSTGKGIDSHNALEKTDFDIIKSILSSKKFSHVKYITVEYYQDYNKYIEQLHFLREII